MNRTLVVVDMQNDFVYGALGTSEARVIVPAVKKKIVSALAVGTDIVFTHDTHLNNYLETQEGKKLPVPHCIDTTPGWEIVDGLDDFPHNYITKNTFAFQYWHFHPGDVVELIGVCTDICVISNALMIKSMCPETEVIVDVSCCAGTTPECHKAAIQVMKSCQITIIGE